MSKPDNLAIDGDGRVLPFSPDQVNAIVRRSLNEGELLAAIFKMPSGELAVQILGEPSRELANALDVAARAYRRALRGH